MNWLFTHLWLIPVCPLTAAGLIAMATRAQRRFAATVSIVMMAGSFVLSWLALFGVARRNAHGAAAVTVLNFPWFQSGHAWVQLGWMLDPLTAVMLVTVATVGILIFIYSLGYMAADENFTRFFCFLSLFAGAMFGLIIANSLLLFFISWELVGLASYLLIGFWYHKPEAAAAAKKAFVVTRIGDLAFLLGLIWLYAESGTLLFFDEGRGCLERAALEGMQGRVAGLGLTVSGAIALLLFCGAVGKSGQVPLHVWLPDAMEGPTPVSALIHAATMVAAGVFLVARVYPLMGNAPGTTVSVLTIVTWVGAITAFFGASVAVAQNDIKRILAYSTISQLGYMMMGLGVGGVAVGIFHLVTHAFFKALLFLGAGSVIHGNHHEQDIRRLGGLRKYMPVTFGVYAIGALALSGFPLFFSGFWSKDAILDAARAWWPSHGPFLLGLAGTVLTAFYMTRQVCYVFFGRRRLETERIPHENQGVMLTPLIVLAAASIALGFLGTPAWPWFQSFVLGDQVRFEMHKLTEYDVLSTLIVSSVLVFVGLGAGYWLYGRRAFKLGVGPDPLQLLRPDIYQLLRRKLYFDEIYEWSIVRLHAAAASLFGWLEIWFFSGAAELISYTVVGLSWVSRLTDDLIVNRTFDNGCSGIREGGSTFSAIQNGRTQRYLRVIGAGVVVLALVLLWGCHRA